MTRWLVLTCLLLPGCDLFRSEKTADSTRDRTTVTKETTVVKGAGEWDHTTTVYREEVSKDVAHSEQTRTTSAPAADSILSLLETGTTGSPLLTLIIAYVTGKVGLGAAKMGGAAVANHIRKTKPAKKDPPNV